MNKPRHRFQVSLLSAVIFMLLLAVSVGLMVEVIKLRRDNQSLESELKLMQIQQESLQLELELSKLVADVKKDVDRIPQLKNAQPSINRDLDRIKQLLPPTKTDRALIREADPAQ